MNKMTCILGTSGAGKTTLLDYLAGNLNSKIYDLEGEIRVGGREFDATRIAYVRQEDSLFPLLTPRESIDFSLQLRAELAKGERENLVENIISEMGLGECADQYIGGKLVRGISGGQK